MLLPIIFLVLGILILLKGADWLVTGASSVAAVLKISPIVIGLTVVAFGTSSPELIVSVASVLSGNTDIALGNIIGSNIANILLILGASALLTPLVVHKNTVWKEIPMSFLGAIILFLLALEEIIDKGKILNLNLQSTQEIGSISASNGLVLLLFFVIFLYYTFGISKASAEEPRVKKKKLSSSVGLVVVGLVGLALGSRLLVDNGVMIARFFGVSEVFIGLTLVAVGTSLPELVTSLVAAAKKQVDIAVGNIIGSNIFNIFFVLGITSLIRPLPLREQNVSDILVLFASTALLFGSLFVMKKHTLDRSEGVFMILSYVAYVVFLVIRG
ncbi:sodium:calcium antiporter [Candidatus Parcubacteria bacterium]|nr:MAG: sodium:calcium antiporter [Candidatus Parcubacteria bacterium]